MTVEELQEALLKEQEANKVLQANFDKLKGDNDKLVADNARLTEYNNKLFMRVAIPVSESETKEPTAEELEAKTIENIKNLMKERNN